MDEKKLKFFAVQINGRDAVLVSTSQEALEVIEDHLAIDDGDTYSIERVDGIYDLIQRMGAFEGYSDDWMEEVLETTTFMVNKAKELMQQEEEKTNKEVSNEHAE